jgi:exonuclease III
MSSSHTDSTDPATSHLGSDNTSNTIKNPYKKIKKLVITGSTNLVRPCSSFTQLEDTGKRSTTIPLPDTKNFWGDQLQTKDQHITRIFFQNINGLSTKDYNKWITSLEWLKEHDVDIAGLAEPCVNVSDNRTRRSYSSKIKFFNERSYIQFANNTNPAESKYQPGGSLLLTNEVWRSRIVHQINDKRQWGRYVGSTFRVSPIHYITIISAYRCVYKASADTGTRTSLKHQRDQIQKLGLTTTPRALCLTDLQSELSIIKEKYGEESGIFILIDANETIEEQNSLLPEFLRSNNLVDVIPSYHQLTNHIDSHERSNSGRRIDFIFGTPHWCQYVKQCGYFPFYGALDGDHRAIFIDLDINKLKDHSEFVSTKRMIGTNENNITILK